METACSSNLDVEPAADETYASTTNLLDPVHSAAAYATVAELEHYASVTAVTKGSREENGERVTRAEEHGENESYGSAIVTEKNGASKPESSMQWNGR
jgi:hypothetical protein